MCGLEMMFSAFTATLRDVKARRGLVSLAVSVLFVYCILSEERVVRAQMFLPLWRQVSCGFVQNNHQEINYWEMRITHLI